MNDLLLLNAREWVGICCMMVPLIGTVLYVWVIWTVDVHDLKDD